VILLSNALGNNMQIHFTFQDRENYGTVLLPYWKPKGGFDIIIEKSDWSKDDIATVIDLSEISTNMFERTYIGHTEVTAGYLTEFEKDQFRYDGDIEHPAIRMTYEKYKKMLDTLYSE
jgi:hypothetical protein